MINAKRYTNYEIRLCREEDFAKMKNNVKFSYARANIGAKLYCIDNKEDDPVLTQNVDKNS